MKTNLCKPLPKTIAKTLNNTCDLRRKVRAVLD